MPLRFASVVCALVGAFATQLFVGLVNYFEVRDRIVEINQSCTGLRFDNSPSTPANLRTASIDSQRVSTTNSIQSSTVRRSRYAPDVLPLRVAMGKFS